MSDQNFEIMRVPQIMVIDDSPDTVKLLTDLLRAEGYEVRPVNSGALALASIAVEMPDLILLDVKMPDIDGYEVCRQLKADENSKKIPVVFICGLECVNDRVKGFMVGGVDFITKPYQQEEVLARVRTQLKLRILQAQLEKTNKSLEGINLALEEEIHERQKAEENLLKLNIELESIVKQRTSQLNYQKELLETVIENIPDPFAIYDKNHILLKMNAAGRKLYPDQDMIKTIGSAHSAFAYFDLQGNEIVTEALPAQRAFRGESVRNEVIVIKRPEKEQITEVNATPIYDKDNNLVSMASYHRDITEKVYMEKSLKESEEKYKDLFNNMLMGHAYYQIITDDCGKAIDYTITEVNPAYEKITRLKRNEIIGKKASELFPGIENSTVDWIGIFGEVASTGKTISKEIYSDVVDRWFNVYYYCPKPGYTASIFSDITDQKNNDEELKRTKEQLLEAQEFAQLGYFELNTRRGEYSWSDELFRIFGFKPQEFKPTILDLMKIVHPDDQELVDNTMKEPLFGSEQKLEYRIVRGDQEVRWMQGIKKFEFDDAGKLLRVLGVIRDITQRKLSELKLKESAEKFKEIAENLGEVIWVRQAGQLEYISPAYEKVWERTCQSLYDNPDSFIDSIHIDDKERIIQSYLMENDTSKNTVEEQYRIITPDGTIRWIWSRNYSIYDKNGRTIRLVGISEDITKIKEYQESLHQAVKVAEKAKTTYQDMFEKSKAIMILVEVEAGKIINANNAACKFYGYTKEQITAMNISEINSLKRPEVLQRMAHAKKNQYFDFQHRLASGEIRDVEVYSSPIRIEDQIYLYSIINDITQRKTLEKAIMQAHENFNGFFNTIEDMLFVLDTEGKIIHINDTVCEKLEYSKEELIGKTIRILHKENRGEDADKIFVDLSSGIKERSYIPMATKSGHEIPVEIRNVMGRWNGQTVCFGVVKDVSELTKSEEKFSKAFNSASDLMAITTIADGCYLDVNDTFLKTLSFIREEVIGKRTAELNLYSEADQKAIDEILAARGRVDNFEVYINRRDGTRVPGIYCIEQIMIGETPCLLRSFKDISKRKEVEEALIKSEQKYKLLFNEMNDAFSHQSIICDELGKPIDWRIITANPSVETMMGHKPEDIIGKTATEVMPEDYQSFIEILGRVALTGEPAHFDAFSKTSNRYYDIKAYSPALNEFATISTDITDRVESEKNIQYLNYHDVLTGLYNRRFYEEELRRLDTERNLPISIVYCDVNGLKLINDAFGHLKGDELLQKAARAMQSACRTDDIIARWGGDEFVILLPKTKTEEVKEIAKRIRETYSKEQVNSISGSISLGWDTKLSMSEDILVILENSEDLMYKHKTHESKEIRFRTIETLMSTLNEKYSGTELDSKRVSGLCQAIGKAIGFSESVVSRVKRAGFYHDIGNVSIEESILNKPEKLTDQEWDEIKRHPEIGFRILSSAHETSELADYVLGHHERWDGTGYPKGLRGKDIPVEARVIALASCYVAMTSERPYRPAFPEEETLQEILNKAGTQFDPEITKVFVEELLD